MLPAFGKEQSPCEDKWRRYKLTITASFYRVYRLAVVPGMLRNKASGDSGLTKPNICLTDGLCVGRGNSPLSCGSLDLASGFTLGSGLT